MENNEYSKVLIHKIYVNIDDHLKNFYEAHQQRGGKSFARDVEETITQIINNYYQGSTNPDELQKLYRSRRNYKMKKKRRWVEGIRNASQPPYDSAKFPYMDILMFKLNSSAADWEHKYGKNTFEDVIQEKLKELEQWKESRKAFLVDYPCIDTLTDKAAYSAFELDIFFEAYDVLKTIIENGTGEILRTYVAEMSSAPYFTNIGTKYPIEESKLINVVPMSENGDSRLVVVIDPNMLDTSNSFKMMDAKDQDILSFLLGELGMMQTLSQDSLVIETRELAKIVCGNDKPSSVHYEEAEARCFRMANATYNRYVNGKQVGAINFLDSAIKREDGNKRYMEIRVGSQLADAVIRNKISRLPAKTYDLIDSNTAKLLYFPLQKRRIILFQELRKADNDTLTTDFMYNDFLTMINFGTGKKSQNFLKIMDALQEYVDNKEVVESFIPNRKNYSIRVTFYPLTDEEQRNINTYNIKDEEMSIVQKALEH